ncbi:glycerol uptake facilitator protein [Hydrogenoanaerobacterium saccharovorans]|uniref:Glycerol uptake facilitator protein n=1 Tax=Hydrogenoanaerobacterium saccharovorans TaxID=474960 RepID=A0A1H7YKS6_9FIRM|nr:MIP/aquaporin family protein [Hydrogenoanaerobacterium saccharovorans]RPF49146.1 glycerol uptake facilitator protein [Hydrogenoanaerobacterium saccharovorans]SEM46866.1 glycerol uptake facilitator protein [Hydrogenoanaerobacterium saccharovorans]
MVYLAEFLATTMLILMGDGVVANVSLNKSGMKGAGSIQITIAWGLAVLLPACIFGAASGAHMNPAMTIAMAIKGNLNWALVPGYIAAQMLGAFFGAILVYLFFKDQFDATEDGRTKLGCFATAPAVDHKPINVFCEAVGTFVLVFSVLGFGNVEGAGASGVGNLYTFGVITAIGMSLGGTTGYAINPARDLGPRIAHAVIPMKNKGDSNWQYAWVPVIGPIIGGALAAVVYGLVF